MARAIALTRLLKGVIWLTGGLCALLGLMAMLGWHTHSVALAQVRATYAPMQYNTALGFLLCGSALLLLLWRRFGVARVCAGIVMGVGLLTMNQYIFDLDLGIDQLLMKPFTTVKTSHPGRMSPNTALCFALAGTALLSISQSARSKSRLLIPGGLASIILVLATVTLVGYFNNVETLYGWGRLTRMAVHTAFGFALIGTGLIAFTWCESGRDSPVGPRWLPISACFSVVAITLCFYQSQLVQEQELVRRLIQSKAEQVIDKITVSMETRVKALIRMARRWEVRGGTSRKDWEADARQYIGDQLGYQAIERVDALFHVRWVEPQVGNEAVQDLDLTFEQHRRMALEAARDLRTVVITRSVELIQGGLGFLVFVPLFPEGRFDGCVIGVFRIKEWLDTILPDDNTQEYTLAVFDGESEIYSRLSSTTPHENKLQYEVEVELYNVVWRLTVWPESSLLTEAQSILPQMTLVLGLMMASLVGLTTYLAQTASLRARATAAANQRLENEIVERRQAEKALQSLNQTLEHRVAERTAALKERAAELAQTNTELERFNRLAVGREQRIIELKRQVNELSEALSQSSPYDLSFLQETSAGDSDDNT